MNEQDPPSYGAEPPQPDPQAATPVAQPASAAASGSQASTSGDASTSAVLRRIYDEVCGVFIGQDAVVSQVLAAFLAGGHVLLEGKPGLGKTHLILALANTFGGAFKRIQFTPDLMPSDVTGHTLYDMGSQEFRVRKGPVFTNLLLADEINRAPAKTQAALLEVMQETQVTIDGETHELDAPFMTCATQNPIEHEGTYPLPEAQLDRFLMKVLIDYPTTTDETDIVGRVAAGASGSGIDPESVSVVCTPEEVIEAQRKTAEVQAVGEVLNYAVSIVRATRETQGISLGAGTRGAISLVRVAKAYAVLQGRQFIIPDDVKRAALPVLRHRVQLSPELAIGGQDVDSVLTALLSSIEAPRTAANPGI